MSLEWLKHLSSEVAGLEESPKVAAVVQEVIFTQLICLSLVVLK